MGALPEEVRRVLGPLEQELQMAVGHHVNVGNQAPGPLENSKCSQPLSCLSKVKNLQSPCPDRTQAHPHKHKCCLPVGWLKEPWRSSSRLAGKPES